MNNLDDLLNKFDWINRVQGFLWSLTSWWPRRRSHKGRKVGGLRIDGGVKRIEVDRQHSTGMQAERALQRAHIPIAGRGVTSKTAYFLVRSRQWKWALYVLLRAGVVVSSPVPADVARWAAGQAGPVPIWGTVNGDRGSGTGEQAGLQKAVHGRTGTRAGECRVTGVTKAAAGRGGVKSIGSRVARIKGLLGGL